MGSSALILALIATSSAGASIPRAEVEKQDAVFERLWNDGFVWKFDDLPTVGSVSKERIPYSGFIYLDKWGGTSQALRKYDRALNGQSFAATAWEQADTSAARSYVSRGFFGRAMRDSENDWYGHCNGWSAAAIRHAEPQRSVKSHGVTFTPSDIKGLLAEVYMYNEIEMLAGYQSQLNPGTFHAILANWIGRGSHPVAMDSDASKEKWNYPIYAYSSSFGKHSPREVEVKTNIAYAKDSEEREFDQSPPIRQVKYFHYMLQLDRRGNIVGGHYFNDSAQIDFVWVPLSPKEPGVKGNEDGNPHVDVAKVMAIWRKSVSTDKRRQWLIVDPAKRDRAVVVADPTKVLPRNIKIVPPTRTAETSSDGNMDR